MPDLPARPPGPATFRIPWGVFVWFDLFNQARGFFNARQGSPGSGYTLGAEFHHVCGPDAGNPAVYDTTTVYWTWSQNFGHSQFCGFGGQALNPSVINDAPDPFASQYTELYKHFTIADRYMIRQQWHRDTTGTMPDATLNVGVTPAYMPGANPGIWPNDLPLPDPFWVPNGVPAPTPIPTPYPLVPHRPTWSMPSPGFQWDQQGNGDAGGQPSQEPDTGVVVTPSNPPVPVTSPGPRPPGPRQREIKKRFSSKFAAAVLRLVSNFTESLDMLGAFYNALPRDIRTRVWRENRYIVRPQDKAEALWRYWRGIDADELVRQLVREQVTDWAYGAGGQRASRFYGEATGSPLGFETGPRQEQFEDAFNDISEDDLATFGDLFDSIWAPQE